MFHPKACPVSILSRHLALIAAYRSGLFHRFNYIPTVTPVVTATKKAGL